MERDFGRMKLKSELSTVHERDFDELTETLTKENISKLNRRVESNKKALLQQYVDSDSNDERDWDIDSNESFNINKGRIVSEDQPINTKQYNRRILSNSSASSNAVSSMKSGYSESDTEKSDYDLEYENLNNDIDLLKILRMKQMQAKNETLARHALSRLEKEDTRRSPTRHHDKYIDNYSKDSDFDDIEEIDLNKLHRFGVSPVKMNKKQSLPSMTTVTSLTGSPKKVKRYQSNIDIAGSTKLRYPVFTGHELDKIDDGVMDTPTLKTHGKSDSRKAKINLSKYAESNVLIDSDKSLRRELNNTILRDTKMAKLTREGRLRLIRSLGKPKVKKVINGHLYGELVYDPVLQKWKGNEEELARFESLNKSIPKLINNKKSEIPQVVGDMVYDNKKLKWVHIKGGYQDDPFGDDFDITFKEPVKKVEARGVSGRLVPSQSTLALSTRLNSQANYFKVTPDMYRIWKNEEERWVRKVSNWFPNDSNRHDFKYELKTFLNKQ